MLVSNQHLEKLAVVCVYFTSHGMLDGPGLPPHLLGDELDAAHQNLQSAPTTQEEECDVDAVDGPRLLSEVTLAKSPSM
jgi:hypothetical protein